MPLRRWSASPVTNRIFAGGCSRSSVGGSPTIDVALRHLSGLAPTQAEVVFLRVLAGLDVDDVAAILGKTPGAVRVLQHRALQRLREKLTVEDERGVTR